jgi:hypothetical protein
LVDFGVLVPKHADILTDAFDPSTEVIIEWRALTVAILDELHKVILERLNLSADAFPLVKVLRSYFFSVSPFGPFKCMDSPFLLGVCRCLRVEAGRRGALLRRKSALTAALRSPSGATAPSFSVAASKPRFAPGF